MHSPAQGGALPRAPSRQPGPQGAGWGENSAGQASSDTQLATARGTGSSELEKGVCALELPRVSSLGPSFRQTDRQTSRRRF